MQGSRSESYQADEENPYWISFSDIMAGLLVVFILAAVALILELTQKSQQWDEAIQEIAKAEQVRKDILQEVEAELRSKSIPVDISDNDTVLRIPEDVMSFRQGKFDVSTEEGNQAIALEIGRVLYSTVVKDDRWRYLDTIFIEGHTDRVPFRNNYLKGNWGLSTFRAISVWNFWNEQMQDGRRLEDLNNHIGRKLFSVSGYAETRPIPCTTRDASISDPALCPDGLIDSEQALRSNRRIDIRFTVRRPALEDYKAVNDAIKNAE